MFAGINFGFGLPCLFFDFFLILLLKDFKRPMTCYFAYYSTVTAAAASLSPSLLFDWPPINQMSLSEVTRLRRPMQDNSGSGNH